LQDLSKLFSKAISRLFQEEQPDLDFRRNRMILQDKVALVTGGASGIGRATAIAFGAAGAKVVFSDIRDVEGEETAALIRETGAECLFVKSDVSSEADVQELVQKAIATYGKLDCAFNNAGIRSCCYTVA
jgi:NAD(P)-dependent dehydrogenase (short-subunit alcohol dehydrogenase family)